jgi:hypothetical protein
MENHLPIVLEKIIYEQALLMYDQAAKKISSDSIII